MATSHHHQQCHKFRISPTDGGQTQRQKNTHSHRTSNTPSRSRASLGVIELKRGNILFYILLFFAPIVCWCPRMCAQRPPHDFQITPGAQMRIASADNIDDCLGVIGCFRGGGNKNPLTEGEVFVLLVVQPQQILRIICLPRELSLSWWWWWWGCRNLYCVPKHKKTHTRWGSDESCFFFARARRDNHFPLCVWWKFKI